MGKEIKDVKDPIRIPPDWRIVALWVSGILLLLALFLFLYIRYMRKKKEAPVKRTIPKVPAFVVALNPLNELEKEKLWQNGYVKEYHSKITEIIRRYFEDRFNLPALELTTTESVNILKERYDARHILQVTDQFLQNADLVKFAKYIPLNSVNEEMMKQAYQIVEQTIPADKTESPAGNQGGREFSHVQ
jgi:hypothetical protein